MTGRPVSARARIDALIAAELRDAAAGADRYLKRTAQDFELAREAPRELEVNFSGGITRRCWSVTGGDGTYRVIYLPQADYFSLCVESDFGPLDIGVHGSALGCFGSV
ncbi:type II toxin-antitoxin system RelE/ParE family toxin [Sulfitobacter sp. D35]|uniref:type II toxin-antitoxin system RelE/ParE family toxin n=1 Tax=Sulfitobacter sp. D35 TaxID=3083252 RepID=UPI00296E8134|nr:type II toxin-antitoxin system RelE/ParE family toxin [Sulfitobacter sp. D35]MDW4498426.1 type II toxin-antitoxin system RelE/ParE family toxin [Sulfitobacter sp. D35]